MSFWTGLEALSGHRPGAFTGFSMKDLFDKDMWEIRERLGGRQSRQFENTGVVPTTAIYKGMGKEGMFGDVVRPYAGAGAAGEAAHTQQAMANRPVPYPDMRATYPAMPAQTRLFPLQESNITATALPAFVPGVSSTQGLDSIRQWGGGNPNTRGMMWGDPTFSGIPGQLGTTWGAGLGAPTATPPMLDKTTVVTESENPNEFNTTKTTYKQQVPANPTNTLMNMGQKFISGWQDLARKRHEEEMLRRQRGY
jgi:hypothetical protein